MWENAVGIVTMLWGRLLRNWYLIPGRDKGFFPFLSKEFKLAVGPTQPSIKFRWVLEALALEIKWPVVEDDHLPLSGIRLSMRAFSVVLH
jgi:hypothetical protein